MASVVGHTAPALALRFDPAYSYFATGGADSVIALWDPVELAVVRTFDRQEMTVKGVSFSHDGRLLIAHRQDERTLDIVSRGAAASACRSVASQVGASGRRMPLHSMLFSLLLLRVLSLPPSCVRPTPLVCPSAVQIRVADGSQVRSMPVPEPVAGVAFSPADDTLAYFCDDKLAPASVKYSVRVLLPRGE